MVPLTDAANSSRVAEANEVRIMVSPWRIYESILSGLSAPYPYGVAGTTLILVRCLALAALLLSGLVVWRHYGKPGLVSRAAVFCFLTVGAILLVVIPLKTYHEANFPRRGLAFSVPYTLRSGAYAAISGCHIVWLLGWAWVLNRRNKRLLSIPRAGDCAMDTK